MIRPFFAVLFAGLWASLGACTSTPPSQAANADTPFAAELEDWRGSGVLGELVYWPNVESAFLDRKRHIEIWLPPGYDDTPEKRYRVIYTVDGQNVFDPRTSYTGVDFGMDEALVRLADARKIDPVIVVATWNTDRRAHEYSPWHGAPDYADFLIKELMPRVDASFRTRTGPENTFHMGSSMGGLLSWYLVSEFPETFSACGCLSTHVTISDWQIANYIDQIVPVDPDDKVPFMSKTIEAGPAAAHGRYWFDYGTEGLDADYGPVHADLRAWMLAAGHVEGETLVVKAYEGADHNEASWRERLEDPLLFLLGDPAE